MTTISKHTVLFVVAAFISQGLSAQTSKCPPIIVPNLTYQYQQPLKSGFGAELNFWFVPRHCDCDGPFGGLCYLFGPTMALKTQYYPEVRTFDIAASYGQRLLFLKGEISGGYSFADKNYGKSFFHLDPGVGLDLLAANISLGYSFRSAKIDNRVGGMFFRMAISPQILFEKSKSRTLLSTYSKASKADIKAVRIKMREARAAAKKNNN